MNKHQIFKALENMDRFGGSFIQSLAFFYSKADPLNQEKLLNAFMSDFLEYYHFNHDERGS